MFLIPWWTFICKKLTENSRQQLFYYCFMKQMSGSFCQANSLAGNMCYDRKNRTFVNISVILQLLTLCSGLCFLNCYFRVIHINRLMLFMFSLEVNELNIAFQFLILISQIYIQRNKLYHSIWNIFMVFGTKSNNFWWCATRK